MSFFKKLFSAKDKGESPEFESFIEASMEGSRIQNEAHRNTWGLGQAELWNFSQEQGELTFTFPDLVASAPSQIIGTFESSKGTWMWAWANASIASPLARDSVKVRAHGEQHGIKRLTTASWPAKETDAWRMAAVANRLCNTNGVYRGPAGTTFVFFTFGEIKLTKRTAAGT